MDQNRFKKDLKKAIISFLIFVAVAVIFKLIINTMFKGAEHTYPTLFYVLTIIFVGFLGFVPMSMGYKIASLSISVSYFLGLIWHAIADKINGTNLLLGSGLYWRILLIVVFAVIGVTIECIYQYCVNKKIKEEKQHEFEEKLHNIPSNKD